MVLLRHDGTVGGIDGRSGRRRARLVIARLGLSLGHRGLLEAEEVAGYRRYDVVAAVLVDRRRVTVAVIDGQRPRARAATCRLALDVGRLLLLLLLLLLLRR